MWDFPDFLKWWKSLLQVQYLDLIVVCQYFKLKTTFHKENERTEGVWSICDDDGPSYADELTIIDYMVEEIIWKHL